MPFQEGDLVEITQASPSGDAQEFIGLRARVITYSTSMPNSTRLVPVQDRPDGYERMPFFWPTSDLQLVEDAPASRPPFAVGDRVVAKTRGEWPDNVDLPDSMVDVVLTVTGYSGLNDQMLTLVGDDSTDHGGWLRDRFEPVAVAEDAPASRPFAVGDRVRVIRASFARRAIGQTARITQVYDTPIVYDGGQDHPYDQGDQPHPYAVMLENGDLYDVAEVALIEDAPALVETVNGFAVGDRVRTVDFRFCLLDSAEVGTVTRVNDPAHGDGQNMAVNFDNIPHGGYYSNGEYVVEGESFDSFEKIEPARPFVVGDRVVLKTVAEHPRNGRMPGSLIHDTVYTISRVWTDSHGADYLDVEEYPGAGGFYPDRFKLASGAPTPAPAPRFRVGDRVRIVQARNAPQVIGRTGTVLNVLTTPLVMDSIPHPYEVRLDTGRSGRRSRITWYAAELSRT